MYVCICNAVTDRDIQGAARSGVRGFAELQAHTGCSTCCGCCEPLARQVFGEAVAESCAPSCDAAQAA